MIFKNAQIMQNEKDLSIAECALNHVGFRAAMHPTWCMADCDMRT